jgi:ABC-type transporter Mla subunit MlaD
MSEYDTIKDEQVVHAVSKVENLFSDMSDRISDTVENIADLADEVEELGSDIKSLLEDLRAAQNKVEQEDDDKFECLIDQLESVSKELQNALWAMELTSEDLLDDVEL